MPPARDTAVAVAKDRHLVTELLEINRNTSLSAILDGYEAANAEHTDPGLITLDQKVLDPVYLILLGLNEECRVLRRGRFYHLPLRQDLDFNHPCDLAFVADDWNNLDCDA